MAAKEQDPTAFQYTGEGDVALTQVREMWGHLFPFGETVRIHDDKLAVKLRAMTCFDEVTTTPEKFPRAKRRDPKGQPILSPEEKLTAAEMRALELAAMKKAKAERDTRNAELAKASKGGGKTPVLDEAPAVA